MTGVAGYGFTQPATGANASLTVDGINISSASNNVSGAVPGLTFNLLTPISGVDVSLGVSAKRNPGCNGNQPIRDRLQQGDCGSELAVHLLRFERRRPGDRFDGPQSTKRSSRRAELHVYADVGHHHRPEPVFSGHLGEQRRHADRGFRNLQSTLQNNFSDVQSFFQGTALNGFANSLDQQLTSFTIPSNGAFTVDLQSISSQDTDLQTDITNFQTNYITLSDAAAKRILAGRNPAAGAAERDETDQRGTGTKQLQRLTPGGIGWGDHDTHRSGVSENSSGGGKRFRPADRPLRHTRGRPASGRRGRAKQRDREAQQRNKTCDSGRWHLEDWLKRGSGGELADKLTAFYTTLRRKLIDAQVNRSAAMLEQQMASALKIREYWQQADLRGLPTGPEILRPATMQNSFGYAAMATESRRSNWSA